jgi:hypothetical protein
MKHLLLALGAGLLLTSCAGVLVTDTQTAAVVTERPVAIYIRPFSVDGAVFKGEHPGGEGERPLRQALAPAEFSNALKEELEKLAPARVLQTDEIPTQGWVVSGSIDENNGGSGFARGALLGGHPVGRSHVKIHVRVRDLSHRGTAVDAKGHSVLSRSGNVIYEFDVAGGSRWSGKFGSVTAPGTGYSTMFDYRNAADRIRSAIEPDAHRYGDRGSTTVR